MKKYRLKIKRIETDWYIVEADNLDEAKEYALHNIDEIQTDGIGEEDLEYVDGMEIKPNEK